MSEQSKQEALCRFIEVFSDTILCDDLGARLTCIECEAMYLLLLTHDEPEAATAIRDAHCREDCDGDLPEHLERQEQLEKEDTGE